MTILEIWWFDDDLEIGVSSREQAANFANLHLLPNYGRPFYISEVLTLRRRRFPRQDFNCRDFPWGKRKASGPGLAKWLALGVSEAEWRMLPDAAKEFLAALIQSSGGANQPCCPV